jgi:hypothetical protein
MGIAFSLTTPTFHKIYINKNLNLGYVKVYRKVPRKI